MKTGVFNYVPVSIQLPTTYAEGDTVTINAQITAAPTTGGNANAASVLGTGNGGASNADGLVFNLFNDSIGTAQTTTIGDRKATSGTITDFTVNTDAGDVLSGQLSGTAGIVNTGAGLPSASSMYVVTSASNTTSTGLLTVYLGIKPDLAGSYGVLISTNAGVRTSYAAGDTRATATLITTGAVATVALKTYNTSPVGANSTGAGVVFKVTLTDSAASATTLGSLDTVTFSSSSTSDLFYNCWSTTTCTTALTGGVANQGMFTNGVGYFKVSNTGTASSTSTITATTDIVGGTNSSTTASASFKAMVALGATAASNTLTQGLGSTTAGYDGTPSQSIAYTQTVSSTATTSAVKFTLPAAAAAAAAFYVTVVDTDQKIFGSAARQDITYQQVCSIAAAATSCSVTTTHAVLGTGKYTVQTPLASLTVIGIGATAAIVSTDAGSALLGTNTVTATPAGPIAAVAKGTVTLTANVTDRFSNAVANAAVTVTVAGRNTVAATSKLSDADGNVTFTYTDAGTITANDTVTFSYTAVSTAATDSVTVTFGGAAVSTVTLTTPNTTLGVATATTTVSPISAGDGAEAGVVAITATIKDASGNLLVGVPVTWTVSGTTALIPSAEVTSYSSTAGVASSSVYAWKTGAYTVTATAGTIAGTGAITFGSTTATNARVLSASVNGNVVTATVVDRFGNPVKGVTVYAVKTGAGYFGSGLAKTSDTTLADGTASFGITGGDASVTVTTLDPTAAAGTNAYAQTCALAGNATCASGATAAVAFTASVAGTTLVSETYTGASFAPAGVSSVTVSITDAASTNAQVAADAAAEATDAANAATDAANAAAEAADAATAAAQDAADAVAALSAQVASLISGLKAQLTALTNLVIKIQKKVKA
jgi:hypothetical protein